MKCVLLGDPIVPSQSMLSILGRLQTRGVEFLPLDWETGMGLKEFYKLALQLESRRPKDLPTEMHKCLAEAEIIVTDYAPVSKGTMELAPKLRLIGCIRGGTENIDLTEAKRRGITVAHAPGRNSTSVADFTLGLLLALHRHIAAAHCMMKQGIWNDQWSGPEGLSTELSGKTIGIIGYGAIGRKVALRAKAFEMGILVHDPYVKIDEKTDGVRAVDLETLLRESDFVTVHVRMSPGNKNLIGEKQLGMMKRSAYLINTARAPLVDEEALFRALAIGQIQGAALDVFSQEPPPPNFELARLENVVLTPHLAGSTVEGELVNGVKMIAEEIDRFLACSPLVKTVQ